ncbi:hypothetical protein J4417_04515 [Candidatus Woesearchaeota archaeon]|nr:hypothetical protein [Candidatus Woesearchaeota archaeon]
MLQKLLHSRKANTAALTALLSFIPSTAEAKKPQYPILPIPTVSYSVENPEGKNYFGLQAWDEPAPSLGNLEHLLIMASPTPKRPCYLDYGEECLNGEKRTQTVYPESNPSPGSSHESTARNTEKIWGGVLLGAGVLIIGYVGIAAYAQSKHEGPTGYYCSPSNLNCETKVPINESKTVMGPTEWISLGVGSIAIGGGIYLLVKD